MPMDELQHVHSGALQLKQQQQELLSYFKHVSTDVVMDELPRVRSDALRLKQQAMLPIACNQLPLETTDVVQRYDVD